MSISLHALRTHDDAPLSQKAAGMRGDQRDNDSGDDEQESKRVRVRCLANLLTHKHGTALPPSPFPAFDPHLDASLALLDPSLPAQRGYEDYSPSLRPPLSEESLRLDGFIKDVHKEWKAGGGKREEKSIVEQWACFCPQPGAFRQAEGDAAVLLLSDPEAPSSVWSPLLPLLKAQRFETVECCGLHGSEMDVAQVEDHALAVAEKVGAEKPLHVVALGAGAMLALHLAAKRPDLVKRLVLASPKLPEQKTAHRVATPDATQRHCSPPEQHARKAERAGLPGSVVGLLQEVMQPTMALSADDDPDQKNTLALASLMDDCRYFDLGAKSYPLQSSEPTVFANILADFLHEESDTVPFPFLRR